MKCLVVTMLVAVSLGAGRADLRGKITTADGKPIARGTAYVYTAGVKHGASPYCPSCYADCGKTAVTNSEGEFFIKSLDEELVFRILCVADGYKPVFVKGVDPAKGEAMVAKLESLPEKMDAKRVVKGRVVGPSGEAVVGAIVSVDGEKSEQGHHWGRIEGVDPMSITNERGEFLLVATRDLGTLAVEVEARGLATRCLDLSVGEEHEVTLGMGASVIGRVLKDGRPVSGVMVGIVQVFRGEGFTGAHEIGTDFQGRFTFSNLAPKGEWYVYGIMSSMGEHRWAMKCEKVQVDGEGTTSDVGDLSVEKSYNVKGRVMLSDGKQVPAGTRVMLGRDDAWDSLRVTADEKGGFEFRGVPDEEVSISVRIEGYRLSSRNRSLDRVNNTGIVGLVDGDIAGLTIEMEPGKMEYKSGNEAVWDEMAKIRKRRIEGVPGPRRRRPVNEDKMCA